MFCFVAVCQRIGHYDIAHGIQQMLESVAAMIPKRFIESIERHCHLHLLSYHMIKFVSVAQCEQP